MDLKKLIKEVERLNEVKDEPVAIAIRNKLEGIKETVEAVTKDLWGGDVPPENIKDWKKLKELLSLSKTKKSHNSSFIQDCYDSDCTFNRENKCTDNLTDCTGLISSPK